MKKLLLIVASTLLITSNAFAGSFGIGAAGHIASVSADGTETTPSDTGTENSVQSATAGNDVLFGSIFAEYQMDNGFVFGLDYIPLDIELGSGKRTDSSSDHGGADSATDVETGTRKAEANIENLITIYTHIPLGPVYGVLGYHDADITTDETLPTSTYGDASVNGIQYGIGAKGERVRAELVYSDFDSISLTSSANTNKISADADALALKISYSF